VAGDDPSELPTPEDRGRGYLEQPPWKRFLIASAGPGFNLLFPVLIYFGLGLAQNGQPTPAAIIGMVTPGSPAQTAGLRPGDRILSVAPPGEAPKPVRWFSDLRELVSPHPAERLQIEIERGGSRIGPIDIVPATDEDSNPVETTKRGVIGISPSHPPALVAPASPGAAGPLEPFDLVVKAGGRPVHNLDDLEQAVQAAACGPIDLEVAREEPVVLPGAAVTTARVVPLKDVPTCRGGAHAFLPADPNLSTFIAAVLPGSPEEKAGLRRGDAIDAVNGRPVRSFRDIGVVSRDFRAGVPVELALHDGRKISFLPATEMREDDLSRRKSERVVVGLLGDRRNLADARNLIAAQVELHRGPLEIAALSWRELVYFVRVTVLGLYRIATRQISFDNVGGPLMLFKIAADAAEEGLSKFVSTMALISVNLGLMNLLPIPVLDGGHIVAAAVESVTRRPLSLRTREIANIVGLILLFTLMLFVFKNDIARFMAPPQG
jgi:regulator of sigma E protease